MKTENLSKKNFNLPLQKGPQRTTSHLKSREFPAEILTSEENISTTPTSIANRLVQKRVSIDRKIESMRKQKFEAEMKQVQSKPNISVRSRNLALKAEKKLLGIEEIVPEPKNKRKSVPNERKKIIVKTGGGKKEIDFEKFTFGVVSSKFNDGAFMFNSNLIDKIQNELDEELIENKYKHAIRKISVDDIIEIEEDIKMLEKCLNIEKGSEKSPASVKANNVSPLAMKSRYRIIEKVKASSQVHKSAPKAARTTPINPRLPLEKSAEASPKLPPRRFIKKSEKSNKKSCSMEAFNQVKFSYRSLSPYYIQVTRHKEN